MKNIDKILILEVTNMLSAINFIDKYSQTIKIGDINIFKNLKLINIKKYQRYNSQI